MKAIVPIGILAAGALATVLILRKKPKAEHTKTQIDPIIPDPSPSTIYPIKYGSRGEKVNQLQIALAIYPDGIFGTNTLNTLQKKAGVSQINDEAQFASVLNKVRGISQQSEVDATRLKLSYDIIARKKLMPFSTMTIAYDTQVTEQKMDTISLQKDKFVSLGISQVFKTGTKFNDWSAISTTNSGFLIVRIGSKYFVISPFPIKIN
jgi:hypothetical protein